jgi:autotransporter-associated beta strand protein
MLPGNLGEQPLNEFQPTPDMYLNTKLHTRNWLLLSFGAVLILALLCVNHAPAANITFSVPTTVTTDTDAFAVGQLTYAYDWSTAQTVNGVPFTATTGTTTVGGGAVTLSGFSTANASAFTSTIAPFSNLSTAYKGGLVGAVFNSTANTAGTVTLNNLSAGRKYQVQVWAGDPRTGNTTNRAEWIYDGIGGATNLLKFNMTATNGGLGQWTHGSFTADSSSQNFTLDATAPGNPGSNNIIQINALQVRDVTGVWSGTTSGNWADSDAASANFTGLSFSGVKALGVANVNFADRDGNSAAVATSAITVGAGGASGVNAVFQNNSTAYILNSADATGIAGTNGVTLNGAGNVTFNGANSYTGPTTLNAGMLAVGNASAIANSAAIVLNGGTLDISAIGSLSLGSSQTLSGLGTINGSIAAPAGSVIIPGGTATAGTLAITNNLTLNGQTMTFDLGFTPSGGDKVVVGNTLTVNSTCTISLNYLQGTLLGGTYTLMTFPSMAGAGTFVLDTTYPGVTLNVNATSVTLSVGGGGGGTSSIWTNLLGGTWGATTNWQGNIIATNVDGVADFSTLNITAARTVTINGIKTIGYLVFGDTVQDSNWTLSTGTNVLAVSSGSPKVVVNNGQNTAISASLQGTQGFTKLGGGTLTLGGANVMTGGIVVNGGVLTGTAVGSFGSVNTVATANPITLSNALLTISAALANSAWTNNLIFTGTSNNITAGAATPGFRGSTGSSVISGSGIVTLNCGGNTPALAGHMDGFTGTLIINASSGGGLLFAHNQDSGFYPGADGITGSAAAVFDFEGGGVNYMYNGAMSGTNYMGELRGNSAAVLFAKNGRSGDVTLEIGGLGTSSEFAGAFRDNRAGASPYTPINIRKVGAGTLTLSGTSLNTGTTDVRNGKLLVTGNLGATPVTVRSGAIFELDGSANSPTITVNTGGNFVVGAGANLGSPAIALNGSMDVTAFAGSFNLGSATLSGSGTINGGLTLASTSINPGPIGAAGTLTLNGGDLSISGGTISFDLSNDPINGANDQLVVNGNLNLTAAATINVNKLNGTLGGGTYPLIKFTGLFNGIFNNLILVGAGPLDVLQLNGQEIDLVVSPVTSVTWTGGTAGNLWDILTSPNWLLNGTQTTFTNGEAAVFTDLGATNPLVTIPATVAPVTVLVNSSSNYTFTGADISDGSSLTKSGTGTLTLLNTNTFVGSTFVNGGTLKLGDGVANNGSVAGNIIDNSALVVANPTDQSYGGVISGAGSFVKQGAGTLILTNDSLFSGITIISAGTLSLGDGVSTSGSLGTGRITNNSTLAINRTTTGTVSNNIAGTGGIVNVGSAPVTLKGTFSGTVSLTNDVGAGTLNLAASNSYSGGTFLIGGLIMLENFSGFGTGNVSIDDNAAGGIHLAPVLGTTNILANNIKLPLGSQQQFEMDGTSLGVQTTVRLTGVLSGGANGSSTVFVDSGVTGNTRGVLVLDNPANTFTTIPEVFRGTLAITSDGALGNPANGIRVNSRTQWTPPFDVDQQGLRFDANAITLGANRSIELVSTENIDVQNFSATIAGPVTGLGLIKLGSGTLTLNGPGSLTSSTAVNAGKLIINNTWAGDVSVASGATLGGTGSIQGAASISAGATIAPGASIGTLTVTNTVSLAAGSFTLMEINASSLACDKIAGATTITFGGTLTVLNTGGTLALGQSFQLFNASSYVGNFTATNLPSLGGGLQWNWNPASGTLSVATGVSTNPTNITATVSGGNLNLSWPADHTGWRLQAQTNSTGLTTNWGTVPGSSSVNSMSFAIDPANRSVFFRLVYP